MFPPAEPFLEVFSQCWHLLIFSSHVPPSVSFSSSGLCPSWDVANGAWTLAENNSNCNSGFVENSSTSRFPGGAEGKESAAIQETQVQSLDEKDPLEEGMATHSSILLWRIPWTEEPGWLQSMGSQRVGHD